MHTTPESGRNAGVKKVQKVEKDAVFVRLDRESVGWA